MSRFETITDRKKFLEHPTMSFEEVRESLLGKTSPDEYSSAEFIATETSPDESFTGDTYSSVRMTDGTSYSPVDSGDLAILSGVPATVEFDTLKDFTVAGLVKMLDVRFTSFDEGSTGRSKIQIDLDTKLLANLVARKRMSLDRTLDTDDREKLEFLKELERL